MSEQSSFDESTAATVRTVQQAEATTYALRLVKAERIRQDTLKAEGRFEFTCAECWCCHREVYIPDAAAWPAQCPHCRTWSPGFQSTVFAKVIQPLSTSVIQPGLSIQVPLG